MMTRKDRSLVPWWKEDYKEEEIEIYIQEHNGDAYRNSQLEHIERQLDEWIIRNFRLREKIKM
jgi:hypothetical protein